MFIGRAEKVATNWNCIPSSQHRFILLLTKTKYPLYFDIDPSHVSPSFISASAQSEFDDDVLGDTGSLQKK